METTENFETFERSAARKLSLEGQQQPSKIKAKCSSIYKFNKRKQEFMYITIS